MDADNPVTSRRLIGPTVYILGAGCSHHTGAPLLGDFLVAARLLTQSGTGLTHSDSFTRVFQWIDDVRSAAYYVDFDLDNVEHVFSVLEMQRQLGLSSGPQLVEDLLHVIQETLDQCSLRIGDGAFIPDPLMLHFVDNIRDGHAGRATVGRSELARTPDTIITFNYDVMLDHATLS